jgi:hypothetical protein
LDLLPEEFALHLEAYLVGGGGQSSSLDVFMKVTCASAKQTFHSARPLTKLISTCRQLIQDGLGMLFLLSKHVSLYFVDQILQREHNVTKVQLNYVNYERKVVEPHGVALDGWPVGQVQNPSKIGGRSEVQRLLTALRDGTCKWVKLNAKELKERVNNNIRRVERGEQVYVHRKKPTRVVGHKFLSARMVPDESGDDEQTMGAGGPGGSAGEETEGVVE